MDASNLVLEKQVTFVTGSIKHVIETFGPRPPGSEGEKMALEYIKDILKGHVDEVKLEAFKVAPKALMGGFEIIAGMLSMASIILYWFSPIAGFSSVIGSLIVYVLEFIVYKQIVDPFFPKSVSHNLIAIKKPTGKVKRRIMLNGHVDAAYENRLSYFSSGLLAITTTGVLVVGVLSIAFNGAGMILNSTWAGGYDNVWGILGIVLSCLLPFPALLLIMYRYSVVAPGANDNLTGTFIPVAIAKHLSENAITFENTEIWYVITGSEEAGLRGAKAFARLHGAELQDVETACIVFETIRDLEELCVLKTDLNGTVRLDSDCAQLLKIAGKNCGREVDVRPFVFGGGSTDAAAFQQGGIPSGGILAMPQPMPKWYHTRHDDWDNLDPECIKFGLNIGLEAVRLFDINGKHSPGQGGNPSKLLKTTSKHGHE